MKRSKKIVALFLAVLMVLPLLAVPSFAAESDPYACLKEGIGYLAVGDSFTRGYGAGENWQDQIYLNDSYGNFACRNVDGSYPNRVAEAFSLNAPDDIRDTSAKLWPLAHDAVSVAYVLDLLGIDDGFRDEEFTYQDANMLKRYAADLQYFGDPLSLTIDGDPAYGQTGEIMSVRDMFKNASLITIGLGQTDVIYKAQIFGLNTLDTSNAKNALSGIGDIFNLLKKYFNYWKDAYPLLLDYIKENNPDAKVVLVGTLNPIRRATMTDDIEIEIGSLINGIMDAMNAYTRRCASKYGYMYVDISDVDTPSSVTRMSLGHILSISDPIEYALIAHPTPHGYAQIAERVIDVVENDLENGSSNGLLKIKDFFAAIIDWFRVFFFRAFVFLGSIGK